MGQIYIPKKIREAIGMKVGEVNEITLIGDASTLFIIPIDFDAYDALKSLEVIATHLRHEVEARQ